MDPFVSTLNPPQETQKKQEMQETHGTQSPDSSPAGSNSSASLPESPASDVIRDPSPSPKAKAQKRAVHVPNMFSSIMAIKPIVNPNYYEVKPKGDAWITRCACSKPVLKRIGEGSLERSIMTLFYIHPSRWQVGCQKRLSRPLLPGLHLDDILRWGGTANDVRLEPLGTFSRLSSGWTNLKSANVDWTGISFRRPYVNRMKAKTMAKESAC